MFAIGVAAADNAPMQCYQRNSQSGTRCESNLSGDLVANCAFNAEKSCRLKDSERICPLPRFTAGLPNITCSKGDEKKCEKTWCVTVLLHD